MKRILVGFIMDGKAGGIDRYLLNFLEAVQSENVRIDFLTDEIHDELKIYLEQYHCELYAIAGLRHPIQQYRQVCEILKKKKYDMIYLNVSTAIDCIAAFAAKHMEVQERVIHSHSSGNACESKMQRIIYNVVHSVCRHFFYRAGTRYLGCSEKAGRWIFPKKIVESGQFEVIYNAVDTDRFRYDAAIREEVRAELGLEGNYVIGHIGNFCYPKNYPFLIDVFEQIYRKDPSAFLLLAGNGVEFDEVRQMVKKKNLQEAVRFLGWRSDTHRLYMAMDLFLMPSRFEGLPIVGVEAQSTGLPCVFSDAITEETKISEQCSFLSLKDGAEEWARNILQCRQYDRKQASLLDQAKNYDLENQKSQLRGIVCQR